MFDVIDWRSLLMPDTPVLEITVRGSVITDKDEDAAGRGSRAAF